MTWSLMSRAPRPQTYSSSTWPSKAPWVQSASVPGTTGTTSMWPKSSAGRSSWLRPGTVSMSEWSNFSTRAASKSSGKLARKKASRRSKAAQSVWSCVGPSTVGMESSAPRRPHRASASRSGRSSSCEKKRQTSAILYSSPSTARGSSR